MHLGNYFGAIKPLFDMASDSSNEVSVFLPDLHSLTSVHDWDELRRNRERLLKEFFALMPEWANITVYEQSKITHINNITWMLSSVTPYALMTRAHSFKDAQNKGTDLNMATFNYPILMTADIISYDFDVIPVWKDQKQHIEFARDIAGNFNKTYKTEIFKLPEEQIDENVMTIPGTDWRKMSKSYDNFIGIFDSEKLLKKKIMSIVTGSEALEDAKDPESCNIFAIIKLFATQVQQDQIAAKYRAGNYWYGHAKLELLEIILEYFAIARKKYDTYENNMSYIEKKLEEWNAELNKICNEKYKKLLKITGLN